MSLSNLITTTLYADTVPSTGKSIKFRPFVVKEERALMMAQESEDNNTMLLTLENIVKGCVKDSESIKFTTFDIEYLFVKIRCKSIEEYSTLIFTCKDCKEKTSIEIKLDTVYVDKNGQNSTIVKLSPDLSVELVYPSVSELINLSSDTQALSKCLKTIYKGDESHNVADSSENEVIEFLDNLSSAQYKLIEDFYTNIPETRIDVPWKCSKCGADHTYELKGINNFF